MKKRVLALTALMALLGQNEISADPVKDLYKQLVGTSIVTSNNNFLQTGWYEMDGGDTGDDIEWANANFVGSYYMGKKGDTWRPIVLGGFGLSHIEQRNVTVDPTSQSNVAFDSIYWKIGGGVNYNPTENLGLVLTASGCWMSSDKDFERHTGTPSNAMLKYFDSDSDTAIYDIALGANYHTSLPSGYKPYMEGTLHYLTLDYDFDIGTEEGWNVDLSAGVFTPELTRWWDHPVRGQLFVAATLFDDTISDVTNFDNAYHAGASLLWHVGPMFDEYLDAVFHDSEIAFNVLGSVGDNDLRGFKVSASFFIAKY
jgi:hypothetical protein